MRFNNLSHKEKVLVLWTILHVYLVKLIIRFIPLRCYYQHFFKVSNHDIVQPYLSDISTINIILKKLKINVTCLEETMIVKSYLKRQGIDMNINLGVRIDKDIKAHAWILPTNNLGYKKIN